MSDATKLGLGGLGRGIGRPLDTLPGGTAAPAQTPVGGLGRTSNATAAPATDAMGGAAAPSQDPKAAAEFKARFPGVSFTGTPNMAKIGKDVTIEAGATIEFPDPKHGAIELSDCIITKGAHVSTPKEGGGGTGVLSGSAVVAGGLKSFTQSQGGGSTLRIHDSDVHGTVSAFRSLDKTTVEAGGTVTGTGDMKEAKVCSGAVRGGNGGMSQSTLNPGAKFTGNGDLIATDIPENCLITGNGTINDSTFEAGVKKSGNGDVFQSTLETGSVLAGDGNMTGSRLERGAQKLGNGELSDSTIKANVKFTENRRVHDETIG